jgi:broad specificity phosphatase PhoE
LLLSSASQQHAALEQHAAGARRRCDLSLAPPPVPRAMGCGASSAQLVAFAEKAEWLESALERTTERLALLDHRPARIFLMRHGECMSKVDASLLEEMPAEELPLSPAGVAQAEEAGRRLVQELHTEPFELWVRKSQEPRARSSSSSHAAMQQPEALCGTCVRVVPAAGTPLRQQPGVRARGCGTQVSPHRRCRETALALLRGTTIPEDEWPTMRVDVRLRDQDSGGPLKESGGGQCIAEQKQRQWEHGAWDFRFAGGEKGSEVYGRVDSFVGSLMRHYQKAPPKVVGRNALVISHGTVHRLFLMRWCERDAASLPTCLVAGGWCCCLHGRRASRGGVELALSAALSCACIGSPCLRHCVHGAS